MNDDDIRMILEEGLSGPPSEGFNERVLATIAKRDIRRKRRYVLADEPLLIGLGVVGGIMLCLSLGWRVFGGAGFGDGGLLSLLPLVLLPLLPIFIVLFNSVTGKVLRKNTMV
jgi:hypothetical protein